MLSQVMSQTGSMCLKLSNVSSSLLGVLEDRSSFCHCVQPRAAAHRLMLSGFGFHAVRADAESEHTTSASPPPKASPTDACSLMLGCGGSVAAAAVKWECTAGDARPPSPTDWISPTCRENAVTVCALLR